MKKFFGLAIATSLMLGVSPTAEAAPTKTCLSKQVNLVKNGQVCKKVGTVYRWVAQPAPKSTVSVQNAVNPVVTPVTNTQEPIVTPKPVPVVVSTPTIDPRMQAFYDAMNSVSSIQGNKNVPISYNFDPAMPQKFRDWLTNGTNATINAFGNTFADGKKIYVIGAYSNIYANTAWKDLYNNGVISYTFLQAQPIDRFFPLGDSNPNTSGAWATIEGNNLIITYAGNPNLPLHLHLMITAMHETFHQVQYNLNLKETENLPCWYVEGGANFIALSLANKLTDKNSFDIIVSQLGTKPDTGFDFRKLEGVSSRVYGNQFCGDVGEYQQGAIVSAFVVEKFGITKYLDFYKVVAGARSFSADWVTLFESYFGESVDDFYTEAQDYVRWFYSQYFDGYMPKISTNDGA
jgi:dihydrofolate reductase